MADAVKLAVRKRTVLGKKTAALRRAGVLPGVVYGQGPSEPVETDAREFEKSYRRWGSTTLLSLEGIGADGQPALITSVSRDPVTGQMLHVDFERVSLTERTRAVVPLRFLGVSPALKAGGVLVHAIEHVRVEALPQDIPHAIDVDLTKLEAIDDAIYARDLIFDVTTMQLAERPDALVVKAVHQRAEEVPTPAAVAAPTAEGAAPAEGAPPAEGAAPAAGAAAAKAPAAGAAKAPPAAGAKAPTQPAAKPEKK